MTLWIVILSVTNIALGFGLAIYLGHARAPWAPGKRTTTYRLPAWRRKNRESQDNHTGTIGQSGDQIKEKAAAEAVAETADEVAKDKTSPEEMPTAEIAG